MRRAPTSFVPTGLPHGSAVPLIQALGMIARATGIDYLRTLATARLATTRTAPGGTVPPRTGAPSLSNRP